MCLLISELCVYCELLGYIIQGFAELAMIYRMRNPYKLFSMLLIDGR